MRKFLPFFTLALILGFAADLRGQNITATNVTTGTVTLPASDAVPQVTSFYGSAAVYGTTPYYYWFVSHAASNVSPVAGPLVVQAPASLSSLNNISVTWTPVAGILSYDLLRTATSATPTGACNCAVAIATTLTAVKDSGAALQAYSVSTVGSNWTIQSKLNSGIQAIMAYYQGTVYQLAPTSSNSAGGTQTFNVQNAAYGAKGNTRKLIGAYSYSGSGTSCSGCTLTEASGNGFLPTDVGKDLDCYYTAGPFQAIDESVINSYISATQITFTGTVTGSGGRGANVCVIGNDDTAAIQSAIAALVANGLAGNLYIPCGGYLVISPLQGSSSLPAGSLITGDGSQCVRFYVPADFAFSTTAGTPQLFSTEGGTCTNCFMGGINFDGLGQTVAGAIRGFYYGGGMMFDLGGENLTAVSAADTAPIICSVDSSCSMWNIRCGIGGDACASFGSGSGNAVYMASHRSALVNPQIYGTYFTNEEDTSIIGGTVATVNVQSQSSTPNMATISGTRIIALVLNSDGGAVLNGANVGPCSQGLGCAGTESGTGISLASGSTVIVSGSFLSGGGAGNAAISNAGSYIDGGANTIVATNSATQTSGAGTFQWSTSYTGTLTAGDLAVWNNTTGGLKDGGAALGILSFTNATIASNISVTSNTVTSLMSSTVTLPAGCGSSCRAHISYSVYIVGGTIGMSWLSDGTNLGGMSYCGTVSNNFSFCSGSWTTPAKYSSNPTFTLSFIDSGAATACSSVLSGGSCGAVSGLSNIVNVPSSMQVSMVLSN